MNRRILDKVSVTALEGADPELRSEIFNLFGEGTLVEDAIIKQYKFNKSDFGLSTTTIAPIIKLLSKEFNTETHNEKHTITDSDGNIHEVSREAISIIKAITLYTRSCPICIADCLDNILKEIDSYFRGNSEQVISVVIEEEDDYVSETNNNNLMKVVRQEVYSILREAGVNIE